MPINMKHCRFENTLAALRECYQDLMESDIDYGNPMYSLSQHEAEAAEELIRLCREVGEF